MCVAFLEFSLLSKNQTQVIKTLHVYPEQRQSECLCVEIIVNIFSGFFFARFEHVDFHFVVVKWFIQLGLGLPKYFAKKLQYWKGGLL